MGITTELITVFVEMLITVYYLNGLFFSPQVKKIRVALAFSGFAAGLSILSILPINPFVRIFYALICTVLIEFSIYKASWLASVYIAFIYYALAIIADVLCSSLFSLIGVLYQDQASEGARRIYYIAAAKLMHLIGVQIVIYIKRHKNNEGSLLHAIPLILGQLISILICHLLFSIIQYGASSIYVSIGIIGMLYINIVICLYIESIRTLYESKKQKEMAEHQLVIQQEYYEQVLKDQVETRALWHDIKKYLNAMKAIASDKASANTCMEQAEESFKKIHNVVDVGNPIVNGILEYGLSKAEYAGIKLNLDVWIPQTISISPIDLFVIIGNTLDNAIEECSTHEKQSSKVIDLILKQKNRMLYYEISNPVNASPLKKIGAIHGYGLKNVQKCVEKYSGTMSSEMVDNYFIVSIQLNI